MYHSLPCKGRWRACTGALSVCPDPLGLVQGECGPIWPWRVRRTDRKGRRHRQEHIVRKLREADRVVATGGSTAEVGMALGVSGATVARWRSQHGGLEAEGAKELGQPRDETGRPKRTVAELTLDIEMLKELARARF